MLNHQNIPAVLFRRGTENKAKGITGDLKGEANSVNGFPGELLWVEGA